MESIITKENEDLRKDHMPPLLNISVLKEARSGPVVGTKGLPQRKAQSNVHIGIG